MQIGSWLENALHDQTSQRRALRMHQPLAVKMEWVRGLRSRGQSFEFRRAEANTVVTATIVANDRDHDELFTSIYFARGTGVYLS